MSCVGLRHSLGSYSEIVRNTFLPRANLKVSSLLLPKESSWHELGLRGNWDGEHLRDSLVEVYSEKSIKLEQDIKEVAFRCMRIE